MVESRAAHLNPQAEEATEKSSADGDLVPLKSKKKPKKKSKDQDELF